MKNIHDYRAVIFDVDGTLYDQGILRVFMMGRLLLHLLCRPQGLVDLKIIQAFRTFREEAVPDDIDLAKYQYEIVAKRLALDTEEVKSVIERWLYREPLPYLGFCRDDRLGRIIRQIQSNGLVTIAYSDYPAQEKLEALGLNLDYVFSAADPLINCLKPNPRGLIAILAHLSLKPADCLFIGDRDDRDGLCARRVGMDFLLIPGGRLRRRRFYRSFPFTA